jgi:hypothetical protein
MTRTKLLGLVLLALPLCALGQSAPPTLMHRIVAGSFDSSGWALAESTNGDFSIEMPGPYNDFTVLGDPDGVAERIEGIGGKAPNGIAFSALKMIYKTKGTANTEFEKFKKGEGLPSAKVTPVTISGLQALDIAFTDEASSASERVILVGEDLFTLTVEWPVAESTPALAMFKPFVDSFKVLPRSAARIEDPTIWQHDQLNEKFMRTLSKDMCMKKTIATLSRSGCTTRQCQASVGGATGQCVSLATGNLAEFCAAYDTRYIGKFCAPGGLDQDRCKFLAVVKGGFCTTAPTP